VYFLVPVYYLIQESLGIDDVAYADVRGYLVNH
jgi:hypothetical protein